MASWLALSNLPGLSSAGPRFWARLLLGFWLGLAVVGFSLAFGLDSAWLGFGWIWLDSIRILIGFGLDLLRFYYENKTS